ncbi:MAG TPA: hypothetical protein VHW95_04890, partial [Steroidobacteraceae bacterium]|nr:hypothetical protein [Steroidobacteraceae bacterium]
DLFRLYFPARDQYSTYLYHSLNNGERVGMLREIVETNEAHGRFREHIKTALRYFSICTDTRNLVLHSTTEAEGVLPQRIRLAKKGAQQSPGNEFLRPFSHRSAQGGR